MSIEAILHELAILFGVAVIAVLAVGRVGLPPIAGFLLAGIVVGPGAMGLVSDVHQVEVLAELGVALLLFTIGLEFSLERLRHIARYVVLGGGLQVLLTVGGVVGLALALGRDWRTGVFWGFLVALSSTAIVLRALADREESTAPHGRLVIAVLIFQDLCIVPMMLILPMLRGEGLSGEGGSALELGLTLLKAAVVVVGILVLARRIVPGLLHRVAATRRRELFLLTVLLVAMLVAAGTASLGLSVALGAFLAGVVIADTEFVHEAHAHVAPFRDALASLFFVSIGMLLDPQVLLSEARLVFGLFVVMLLGKGALATAAGLLLRLPVRVAVVAGVALAQVGEFSFVLLRSGEAAGLVDAREARVFLAASVLTMIAAPLLVAISPRLGAAGARLLRPLERLFEVRALPELAQRAPLRDHVIIAGLGLGGQLLQRALEATGVPYVAIEMNPDTVAREQSLGRNVRYGDITSAEVLSHVAEAEHARMVVLLVSDAGAARRAVGVIRGQFPGLHVLVRAHRTERDEALFARLGAEVVSEDYETALEVVERVLHRVAPFDPAPAGLAADSSALRAATAMDAVRLCDSDWSVGRALASLALREAGGALIVAIARGDRVLAAPSANQALLAEDVVFVFGSRDEVVAVRERLRRGPAPGA